MACRRSAYNTKNDNGCHEETLRLHEEVELPTAIVLKKGACVEDAAGAAFREGLAMLVFSGNGVVVETHTKNIILIHK